MADTEESRMEEMLMCPVCQDIFKDPRQLPCGHSMCTTCLEGLIEHSSDVPFKCPDCRMHFDQVVTLHKSYALTSIAEDFRLNRRTREKQTKCVYCDYCPEKNILAVKTCTKCEVSLCREHIKDHQELPVFTGHPLVEPLSDLAERRCPQHEDEVLRYYCKSSRRYICSICTLEGKQLNVATEASTVLRRQLTEYMDQHFTTLMDRITESSNTVRKLQEDIHHNKQKMNPASSINGVTIVLLFLWFIVLYYAYNFSVENQMLTGALDKQQNRMHNIYSAMAESLVPTKSYRPKETEGQGALTLDLDTVNHVIGVSADLRTAVRVNAKLDYPNSNSRFDEAPQVLSSQCFSSGVHVWEVDAEGHWDIAASYKSIQRKCKESSAFGNNTESWSLAHKGKGNLLAYHNKTKTAVSHALQSSRIAVVVNFEEGSISFRAVYSTVILLHEFKAELSQPVCLGLGLHQVDPPSRASIVRASTLPPVQWPEPK